MPNGRHRAAQLAPRRKRQARGHAFVVGRHIELDAVGPTFVEVHNRRGIPVDGPHGEAGVRREEELILFADRAVRAIDEIDVHASLSLFQAAVEMENPEHGLLPSWILRCGRRFEALEERGDRDVKRLFSCKISF